MEYCTNCGTEIPDNMKYCAKCGSIIGSGKKGDVYETGKIKPEVGRNAQEYYRSSKHELLESIRGGFIALVLGTLLFIAASGVSSSITLSNFFAYFLSGLGAILVANFFTHLLLPNCKSYRYGDFIGGIILFAIGVLCIYGFDRYFWPMVIVSVGIFAISMGIVKFLAGREPGV
jgi:zinc-ribbon domain